MVSWFRFYADYWQVFYAQHAPDGQTLATAAHKAFLTVVDSEDLWQWFQDHGKVPGVVLLARNKVGKDGKRKIDVMHHLRLIQRSDKDGDDYVVGILQLGGGRQMGGLLVKDMTANLVPTCQLPRMKVWIGWYQHTYPVLNPHLQCAIHADR